MFQQHGDDWEHEQARGDVERRLAVVVGHLRSDAG
jgi:hypothetical protein